MIQHTYMYTYLYTHVAHTLALSSMYNTHAHTR